VSEDEDTAEMPVVTQEDLNNALLENWQLFCPWCGRPAELNSRKPITINCDHCEATTKIGAVT
jgi:hypothetical protein